jgi:transposase InsO family protein
MSRAERRDLIERKDPALPVSLQCRLLAVSRASVYRRIYLLGGISIERVSQVWCSDVTYIPMAKGFLYLVVIMDWVSRAVLAWRLSNTLGAESPRSSIPTRAIPIRGRNCILDDHPRHGRRASGEQRRRDRAASTDVKKRGDLAIISR